MTITATPHRLHERLGRETRAEVYFDRGTRGLYATDASLYQIEPLGVVVPRTVADVVAAVRIAAEEGVPVLPRGAATSLSGQTVGPAVVLDFSKYLNRIGVVDRDRMTVRVEPGVVLDRLNAHLKPLGLMFGPDVSTSDRATIGGMIGNNSAGARSLRYGKTVDHVRAVDVVLADGTPATLGPLADDELDAVCARADRVGAVHRAVRDTVARHREAIAARFPKILRRVSGYNLDEFIPGLPVRAVGWRDEPWQFNLARLIVGSEGTLAVVTAAELKVVPIPPAQGLVVLSFATIPAALDRLAEIVATGPVAVEMLDRMILDLAAGNPAFATTSTSPRAVPPPSSPRSSTPTRRRAGRPRRRPGPAVRGPARRPRRPQEPDGGRPRTTSGRSARPGFSLLMGMVGDAKPIAFVEDTAVAPERLPEFYERFRAIVARHGRPRPPATATPTSAACTSGRSSTSRPREGVEQLRAIAREVSDLVVEFGGAMSGEHGDGLARSLWNAKLFGPEVYAAFEAVKRAFDPDEPDEPRQGRRRARPRRQPPDRPRLPRPTSPSRPSSTSRTRAGFARAVEMCSGVGACRKTDGGTMCPSYMVTRDEEHTTRGRANALRLVMSGALPADGLANETLHEALDLCLQCKACKTECPSNVDMAKLKAEFLHQYYQGRPVPLGSLLMGQIHRLNPIGSATAPLANWTLRQPGLQVAPGEGRRDRPPADPADVRREPPPQVVPAAPARPPRRDARGGRPAGRLLHDLQHPRGRPRGGPGAGGGRLPRRAGRPALLRPAGDLEGAAHARPRPGPRERPRGWSATPAGACRSSAASRAAC